MSVDAGKTADAHPELQDGRSKRTWASTQAKRQDGMTAGASGHERRRRQKTADAHPERQDGRSERTWVSTQAKRQDGMTAGASGHGRQRRQKRQDGGSKRTHIPILHCTERHVPPNGYSVADSVGTSEFGGLMDITYQIR